MSNVKHKLKATRVKPCIHGRAHCWCTARFGNHGLINGQCVEYRGEKLLTFRPTLRIMGARGEMPMNMSPYPAFDGRGKH